MRTKRIFLLTGCALFPLIWGVERGWHRATDGFTLSHIRSELSIDKAPEQIPFELFDQPYHYLECGAQSYVFESTDEEIVLKFFKFHHLRIPSFLERLPLPFPLSKFREKKIAQKNREKAALIESLRLAKERLKEETALLALHLEQTNHLPKGLVLIDKGGIRRKIDPNEYAFLFQRKGILVADYLKETSDPEAALKGLFFLVIARCQKEIFDKDPDFLTNFAFVKGEPIEIDLGRFSHSRSEASEEVWKKELFRITRSFRSWIAQEHPQLIPYFDEEIERCCGPV